MTDAERPAEERRVRKKQAGVVKRALDERDAALVERVRAMKIANEYRDGNAQMYEEMLEARAEAEALRAALDVLEPSLNEWGREIVRKARLSAPAPAPKVDEERLMENLKDFKTFDNRMHGKPPAPVCSCPYRSTRSGRCTNCGMPVREPAPAPTQKQAMAEVGAYIRGLEAGHKCGVTEPAPETAKPTIHDVLQRRLDKMRGATVKAVNEHEQQTRGGLPREGPQEIQRVASEEERGGQGQSRTTGLGSGHEAPARVVGPIEPAAAKEGGA